MTGSVSIEVPDEERLPRKLSFLFVSLSRLWQRNRLSIPSPDSQRALSAALVSAAARTLRRMLPARLPADFHPGPSAALRYFQNPAAQTNGHVQPKRCLAVGIAAILACTRPDSTGQTAPLTVGPAMSFGWYARRLSSAVVRTESGLAPPGLQWRDLLSF